MSRRDIIRYAADVIADLEKDFPGAWARHQAARPALPGATSTDRDGGGPGPSDPTGSLAVSGAQAAHDAETARVDDALRALRRELQFLDGFLKRNPLRGPTSKERAEAERANVQTDECDHCARHRPMGEVPGVHRGPTLASGNLEHPMSLCRFCYDQVIETGRLPSKAEIALNTQNRKRVQERIRR